MSGLPPVTPRDATASPSVSEEAASAGGPAAPLHQLLGDLHDDLAEATSESELVAAVARYAAPQKPHALRLFYFHYDEQQNPIAAELVATWPPDLAPPPGPRTRFPIAQFTIVRLGTSQTDQCCVIPEIASESRITDWEKQRYAKNGDAAVVILPCYSRSAQTWQGVLSLYWPTVHTPTADELFVYNLTARMLTAFIVNRRALLAQQEMLRELTLINEVSVNLNAALNLEQALQALAMPFIERGAASALWSTIYTRPDGAPDAVEVIASWRRQPETTPTLTGQRYQVDTVPLWRLWVAAPDNPLLVANADTDARLDADTLAFMKERQRSALIILPLRTRGRWVGVITISWTEPQVFTSRDTAMARSLANQAAIVFDNRQLMHSMQEAVREHQRQSLALKALLDNMPVGVVVMSEVASKPLIINPKALQILGATPEKAARHEFSADYQRFAVDTGQPLTAAEMPLALTLGDGQPHHMEVDVVRGDATRITLDVMSAPIFDERGALRSAMSLFVDIGERKQAEAERARIQESLIAYQAAALAERSTPLIPISDEITVLPLIGSLDTARGQQILDTLLSGVSQSATRVAIIDVTGVRTLDTQAAQTLTQAAQALRLLGVEPVLTGIRAEVAQTLVSLGVPLGGIVTRSTLQSGIAYANRKKSR